MWLFFKNKGYNTRNFYKIEVSGGDKPTISIFDLTDGKLDLVKTSDIVKAERKDFVEYLKQLLAEYFIIIEKGKKTIWINKMFIKTLEIKPNTDSTKITLNIEAIGGFNESVEVAESYPEFNLFWLRNWKNNIHDDTMVFVPSKDSMKRGKKSKVETVVNIL